MTPPNSQAFVFAHRALPELVRADPGKLLAALAGPGGTGFLEEIWTRAGAECDPLLQSDGKPRHTTAMTGQTGLVVAIEMPAAQESGDVCWLALIARFIDPSSPDPEQLAWARLFTLEIAPAPGGKSNMPMIFEWQQDGSRQCHGAGPAPEEQAFVEAVIDVIWEKKRIVDQNKKKALDGCGD